MVPITFIILISFVASLVTGDNSLTANNNTTAVYEEVRHRFNKLLDAIAFVNEKRLNALKRYTDLEWDLPSAGILRYIESENNKHISRVHKINHEHTKDIIEDALHDIICNHKSRKSSGIKTSQAKYKFKHIVKNNLRSVTEIPNSSKFYYRSRTSNNKKDKSLRKGDEKEALRGSCWRDAYKSCKKACCAALKSACNSYMCSKSMKKDFKYECESNCKYRLN